jgi:hypothetical protein
MTLPSSACTMKNFVSQARERQHITSNDALAHAVIHAHPELPAMKPRSLSVKIGLLDKGDTGWWKARPQWAEALASILMIDVTDLGLHTATSTQALEIQEFPEFPPIDFSTEDLPNLGRARSNDEVKTKKYFDSDVIENWLPYQLLPSHAHAIRPSGITWLEISDQFCTKLLTAFLQIQYKREVLYTADFSFVAARLRRPAPVVIHLSRRLSTEDLRPLMALHEHGAVLIMSPFPPPLRVKSRYGDDVACWEARQKSQEERALMSLTSKSTFVLRDKIKHLVWQLNADWRTDLLAWIEKRVNHLGLDSLINISQIMEWLNRFDGDGNLFSQSSDIFSLAQLCHHAGERVLPNFIELGAGNKLLGKLRPDLNSQNLGILRRLVKSRWLRLETSWDEALSWDEWRSLLDQIHDMPSDRLTDFDLQHSLDAGILSEGSNGLFEFTTPLHASLLARDLVRSAIADGNIEMWGAAVFDEPRRKIIDAVINTIPTTNLVSAVDRLTTTDPWSPASIGAEETLFLALSRPAWTCELKQSTVDRILNAIWAREATIEQFDAPQLWSRPNFDTLEEWRWMQTCWHWSLGAQRPASLRIEGFTAGYFPGWSDTPTWPAVFPSIDSDKEYTSPIREWKEFMRLAIDLSDKLSPPTRIDCSEESSEPLFALTLAWEGQWKPQKEWWEHLIYHHWAEELLLHTVSSGDKKAAGWLWPSFISALMEMKERMFNSPCLSKVWQWIMSTLSPEEILEGRSDKEIAHLCAWASSLPPGVRIHLLNTLPIEWTHHVKHLIEWCPEQSCDVLLRWMDACIFFYDIEKKIWSTDPNYALRILEDKDALSIYAAKNMIRCAPSKFAYKIASILCKRPDLLDREERIHWVKEHLGTSGRQAPHILSVISSNSSSISMAN